MPSGRPGFIVWLKAWFLGLIILHGLTRSKSEFIRHQENVLTKKAWEDAVQGLRKNMPMILEIGSL